MKNNLENFIKDNRRAFNELDVPEGLWSGIEQELERKQGRGESRLKWSREFRPVMAIAASLVLLLTVGMLYWQYLKFSAADLSKINPALAEQQQQYASMIQEKQLELKKIKAEDPQLYQEFSSEIRLMDENYRKLKRGLGSSPNQEATVKAMIKNLQAQIAVLNQQLQIIEHVNDFKKQHENKSI